MADCTEVNMLACRPGRHHRVLWGPTSAMVFLQLLCECIWTPHYPSQTSSYSRPTAGEEGPFLSTATATRGSSHSKQNPESMRNSSTSAYAYRCKQGQIEVNQHCSAITGQGPFQCGRGISNSKLTYNPPHSYLRKSKNNWMS